MILIDSNIIIEFWKKGDEKYLNTFRTRDIFLAGVCKAELLKGAKSDKEFRQIKQALKNFPEISTSDSIWERLGDNLYKLRKSGITVPFQDALIATLALEYSLKLWTLDKHFKMIQKVLPDLVLFEL